MDNPFELDAVADSTLPFSGFDSRDEVERLDLHEIAERRAQLECAETLRRARAL